jgi:hypothetical protein
LYVHESTNQIVTDVFLDVHYIEIMPQLQICPVWQVPQTRPTAPTLTVLTFPFLLKLAWYHISNPIKLFLQLIWSEFRWLVTAFRSTIEFFAISPRMVPRKPTAVPNKADFVP